MLKNSHPLNSVDNRARKNVLDNNQDETVTDADYESEDSLLDSEWGSKMNVGSNTH